MSFARKACQPRNKDADLTHLTRSPFFSTSLGLMMFRQRRSGTPSGSEEASERAWIDRLIELADWLMRPGQTEDTDEDQQSETPKAA